MKVRKLTVALPWSTVWVAEMVVSPVSVPAGAVRQTWTVYPCVVGGLGCCVVVVHVDAASAAGLWSTETPSATARTVTRARDR